MLVGRGGDRWGVCSCRQKVLVIQHVLYSSRLHSVTELDTFTKTFEFLNFRL